ncbi:MAG: hypothetical protein ACP5PT_01650 [Brevinematia bacterium]
MERLILSSVQGKTSGGVLFTGSKGTLKLFSSEIIISSLLSDYSNYIPFNHPDIYCYGIYDYKLYYDFLVRTYKQICGGSLRNFFVRFLSFCLAVRKPDKNGDISSLISDIYKVISNNCDENLVKSILERFETIISKLSKIDSIGIDVIRDIIDFCAKTPLSGYKFVVIPNFDSATIEAQNAFLKTLEEPPKGTFIILTTSKYSNILPTISSRTFRISFLKLKGKDILNILGNVDGINIDEENYYTLFDLVVNYIYDIYGKFFTKFIDVFVSNDLEKAISFAEEISENNILVDKFFEVSNSLLNILLEVRAKVAGLDIKLDKYLLDRIPNKEKVLPLFTVARLYKLQSLLNDSYVKIYTYNFNPKFVITRFFVEAFS